MRKSDRSIRQLRSSKACEFIIAVVSALAVFFAEPTTSKAYGSEENAADAPVVSVLTFGPGDNAFSAFGHNAIRVRDPRDDSDLVYNFGTYQFDTPWLIVDFLAGRFKYWLGVNTFDSMIPFYRGSDRYILEQLLDLDPTPATRLADALAKNALPENRVYLYNYYRDNCSTRVRDAVDRAVGGQLKRQFDHPGSMTLRQHSLRATAHILPVYLGIDAVLGDYIDKPESRWAEMFLPEILQESLSRAVIAKAGQTRPLVGRIRVLNAAEDGPRMRKTPPDRTFDIFMVGAFLGILVLVLAHEAFRERKAWARSLFFLMTGCFGLFTGFLSLVFVFLWAGTDHDTAYWNENLFHAAPVAAMLPVGAIGALRRRPWADRLTYRAAAVGFGASLAGLILKLLPSMDQDNWRIMAFFLPVWTALFVAVEMRRRLKLKAVVSS